MSYMQRIVVFSIACILLAGCKMGAPKAAVDADRAQQATSFLQQLVNGQYAEAASAFDVVMRLALPPEKLQQVWEQLLGQCGAFQSFGPARTTTEANLDIIFIPCVFAKSTLDAKIVFNKTGAISGLWFVPQVAEDAAQYTAPGYVQAERLTEREVTVGTGAWQLPGTLAVPEGPGPFPALVLVHGSGPNDRDESIGPNKPFRDLAQGLASQGIAVLRYDKRTKVYATQIAASSAPFTVREEVTDDALAAVELLRHTEGIDPHRIFVLGHSLGGMLIPRIGQADAGLAGLIVLAGPTRPLEDLMLEQMDYLATLSSAPQAEKVQQLDTVRRQIDLIKRPELQPTTPAAQLLGAPGSYWLDLRGYNPAAVAQTLSQPLLILQGGRDYQVTLDDYAGWQTALAGRPNVSFKLYPILNHLLMDGTGKSIPAEYDKRGPVAQAVIDDLATWIKAH